MRRNEGKCGEMKRSDRSDAKIVQLPFIATYSGLGSLRAYNDWTNAHGVRDIIRTSFLLLLLTNVVHIFCVPHTRVYNFPVQVYMYYANRHSRNVQILILIMMR